MLVDSPDQEIWTELEEISKTMADISTNQQASELGASIDNLTAQIAELNELLSKLQASSMNAE